MSKPVKLTFIYCNFFPRVAQCPMIAQQFKPVAHDVIFICFSCTADIHQSMQQTAKAKGSKL